MLPARGVDYTRWAQVDAAVDFFADTQFRVADHRPGEVAIPFASPTAAAEATLEHSGPWITIFAHLTETGHAAEGRRLLEAHLAERSDAHADGIALRARYATHLCSIADDNQSVSAAGSS